MSEHFDLVIVGLGPGGIATALKASELTGFNILCIDEGLPIKKRRIDSDHGSQCKCSSQEKCDVLSGFGGASLISGTKLSDYPAGSGLVKITGSEKLIQQKTTEALKFFNKFLCLDQLVKTDRTESQKYYKEYGYEHKYYDSYSYDEKKYHVMLDEIYNLLKSKNITIQFSTKLKNISRQNKLFTLSIKEKNIAKEIIAEKVILATGKSGYSLLADLQIKLKLKAKPSHIELGLRLEFPSGIFENINKYQSDLKLKSGLSRTYCISKNGEVVNYSYNGRYYTEGRVRKSKLNNNTNMGIVLRINSSKENKNIYDSIINNYNDIDSGNTIACSYFDFINHHSFAGKLFPEEIYYELHKEVKKFVTSFMAQKDHGKIKIHMLEQDFPIHIYDVNEHFEIIDNLYIIGAATGTFRGIVQSFVSGIICIEEILRSQKT